MPSSNRRRKRVRKPLTDEERAERRERDRKRLEEAARSLLTSDGWARWVKARRFNGLARYSTNNQILLVFEAWAREMELSYVCGYRAWQQLGYQVRKGEKSLGVLAPIVRKVEDEKNGELVRRVVGFRGTPVFDRSQVDAGPDAEPLEPPTEPLTGNSHAELLDPLLAFATRELGCTVSFNEKLEEGVGGFYRHSTRLVAVRPGDANAEVRVLLHELAHAIVAAKREQTEDKQRFPYAEEECIVECASYIAASGCGLNTAGESIPYVASWGEGDAIDVVTRAAALIDDVAKTLEDAITPDDPGDMEAKVDQVEVSRSARVAA